MNTIQFLNLDLDFFVHGTIVHLPGDTTKRVSGTEAKSWSTREVRDFLERRCGLSKNQPIPGRFGIHHDAAFDYWKSLMAEKGPGWQIELTHVDAHADLGLGDPSWVDLMGSHLRLPVERRVDPVRGSRGMGPGNYIAYAMACRWISRMEFVLHPDWRDDLAWLHFKDFNNEAGAIQLKCYPKEFIENLGLGLESIKKTAPESLEPEVPFSKVRGDRWKATVPFEYAFLAQSPNYTPRKADGLIGVFAEYIDFR